MWKAPDTRTSLTRYFQDPAFPIVCLAQKNNDRSTFTSVKGCSITSGPRRSFYNLSSKSAHSFPIRFEKILNSVDRLEKLSLNCILVFTHAFTVLMKLHVDKSLNRNEVIDVMLPRAIN